MLREDNRNTRRVNFFPHKLHPDYSVIELALPRQEAGEYLPESSYFVATDWSGSRSKRLNPDGTYMLQCD